jgi:hypothetical protein
MPILHKRLTFKGFEDEHCLNCEELKEKEGYYWCETNQVWIQKDLAVEMRCNAIRPIKRYEKRR